MNDHERCQTASGPYRCSKVAGHGGECETEDVPRPIRIGPYTSGVEARAYLRGRLDQATGDALLKLGERLGVKKQLCDDEQSYRERIWRGQ